VNDFVFLIEAKTEGYESWVVDVKKLASMMLRLAWKIS